MIALAAVAALFPASARAAFFLSPNGTTGQGYRSFDVEMSFDLPSPSLGIDPPNPDEKWAASARYAYAEANNGTLSRIGEFSAGFDYSPDERLHTRWRAAGARDSFSSLRHVGPTLGISYFWPSDSNPAEPHLLDVSAGAELFFFRTDEFLPSPTIQVRNQTVLRPSSRGHVSTNEFHPYLALSKPLFHGRATPEISAGYYTYSSDPRGIERLVGRPRLSASADDPNGLVGGFLRDHGAAALTLRLSSIWTLRGSVGAAKLVTDNTWAVIQEARLTGTMDEHLRTSVDWHRAIQDTIKQDVVTGGLTFSF